MHIRFQGLLKFGRYSFLPNFARDSLSNILDPLFSPPDGQTWITHRNLCDAATALSCFLAAAQRQRAYISVRESIELAERELFMVI